jgi:hypothetical protein
MSANKTLSKNEASSKSESMKEGAGMTSAGLKLVCFDFDNPLSVMTQRLL